VVVAKTETQEDNPTSENNPKTKMKGVTEPEQVKSPKTEDYQQHHPKTTAAEMQTLSLHNKRVNNFDGGAEQRDCRTTTGEATYLSLDIYIYIYLLRKTCILQFYFIFK
jgi:hypothetical protein